MASCVAYTGLFCFAIWPLAWYSTNLDQSTRPRTQSIQPDQLIMLAPFERNEKIVSSEERFICQTQPTRLETKQYSLKGYLL